MGAQEKARLPVRREPGSIVCCFVEPLWFFVPFVFQLVRFGHAREGRAKNRVQQRVSELGFSIAGGRECPLKP
jgi:hypothetical protein